MMTETYSMNVIARVHSAFPEKFGIPRQSGIVDSLHARIVFEPEYRTPDALRGIEEYSHLWIIWGFSMNKQDHWNATVRPPRLGGNERIGVFSTRSPFRPNPIGLSCVKLDHIEHTKDQGIILHITGADMVDGTPVFDIKPYLAYTDSYPEASGSFASLKLDYHLDVDFPENLLKKIPEEHKETLIKLLSQDPRPSYQNDPERIYGMKYASMDIRFKVHEKILTVINVSFLDK